MTLKELRIKAGLSQDQLARELGISQAMESHIECGIRRPSPELAERIAARFKLTLEQAWDMFYKTRTSRRGRNGKGTGRT